jgi:hypothetical protein
LGKRSGGLVAVKGDVAGEEEDRRKEFESEKLELKAEQEKKKVDDLWASESCTKGSFLIGFFCLGKINRRKDPEGHSKLHPWSLGVMFTPSFTPRGELSLLFRRMQG